MSDPSADPRTPPRADRVELGLWLGLYALSFALRFLQSPAGGVADEELHTPTVAAWLSGAFRPGLLPELQYTAPCGGCTADPRGRPSRPVRARPVLKLVRWASASS